MYNNLENSEMMDCILSDKVIDMNDINEMNVVLNDNNCSDSFFSSICDYLERDGVRFIATKNDSNLPTDNGIIITIDQQYSSGTNSLVFAPFSNTRFGFSDSFALAMRAGMLENGCQVASLIGGKVGYKVDEFGNISTLVPTSTEKIIDENSDISFVTVSIGTQRVTPEMIAKSIESGLARQKFFLDHYDVQTDLVYRANLGESVQDVSNYFGTTPEALIEYNHLPDKNVLNSQTIINPGVEEMEVFNPTIPYSLSKENIVHKSL